MNSILDRVGSIVLFCIQPCRIMDKNTYYSDSVAVLLTAATYERKGDKSSRYCMRGQEVMNFY